MKHTFGRTVWKRVLSGAAMAAAVTSLVACVKGGSISSDGSSSSSGTVTVSLVYPTSEGLAWTPIVDAADNNRFFIKGLDLTISGICSRGINKVKVNAFTETADCLADGSFTFNKTFSSGAQGDALLTLTGYDLEDAAVPGAVATVYVRIDATAPTAPVVTTPASTPYQHNSSNSLFTISGTCTADTFTMTGPGGVTITPSGTSWSYDATLIEFSTLSFSFYAFDRAGNQSSVTTQTIEWAPSVGIVHQGVIPGSAVVTDVPSGFTLEASVFAHPGEVADSGASGYKLQTGLNFITKSVRDN